jgi:glutamate racemase
MRDSGCIGIFDSGVGGLSVWREVVRQLPNEQTIYVADQAHVPYGTRSLAEVRGFAKEITHFLLAQGARVIVVASNTSSAAALYYLREMFPDVSFVGMEPALKPAIERTRTGAVGVLATPATFQGELFTNLVKRYVNEGWVLSQACPGLVDAVEAGALDTPDTTALLAKYLNPMIEANVDQLALGCTHYPFLRPAIERLMGSGVEIIDPAPSVARQVQHIRTRQRPGFSPATEPQSPGNTDGRHVFFTSGDVAAFAELFQRLLSSHDNGAPDVRGIRWHAGKLTEQE